MKYLIVPPGGFGDMIRSLCYLPLVLPRIGPGPRTLLVHPKLARLCGALGMPVEPWREHQADELIAAHNARVSAGADTPDDDVVLPHSAPAPDPMPAVPLWWDPAVTIPSGRIGIREHSGGSGPADYRGIPRASLEPLGIADPVWLHEPDLARYGVTDWAGTAAIVRRLDLVITTDNAIAHLAGALRAPTWLLATRPPAYGLFAADAVPLYPTVRVFRQPAPGDWAPVVARVAEALHAIMPDGGVAVMA